MSIYDYIGNAIQNTVSPAFPTKFNRLIDGNIIGMRFYPPQIVNTSKGFTETDIIDTNDGTNFVNPQNAYISDIDSECANLISLCSTYYIAEPPGGIIELGPIIQQTSNISTLALVEFERHTNRLTGQTPIGTTLEVDVEPDPTRMVPYLVVLDSIGKTVSYLNYVNTGVRDESIMISAYGSIYLDISEYSNSIMNIATQISSNIVASEGVYPFTLTMTPQELSEISNTLIEIYDSLTDTRRSDEYAYANLISDLKDTSKSTSLLNTVNTIQQEMLEQFKPPLYEY